VDDSLRKFFDPPREDRTRPLLARSFEAELELIDRELSGPSKE
jgi:hypothetical protein